MGYSSWDKNEYKSYSSSTVGKSTRQIFTSNGMKDYLNPSGVLLRESRDSEAHPNSTAIIVGLDVTGSMGIIADKIAREGLGTLVNGILDQKIVPDPHIMIMGIGDVEYDSAPLQATQFESDIRIAQQLADIYLEGGGGGNQTESYDLPWYFAAHRTSIDCFEKRDKKGYLFTIGDELPPKGVSKNGIKSTFGSDEQVGYTAAELLASAEEKYQVFHIIVEQGNYARRDLTNVTNKWRQLLSGRAILLSNYNYIAEVILAAIEVAEGADPQTVIDSTQDKTLREVIKHALLD
jgi:hypothetical protein